MTSKEKVSIEDLVSKAKKVGFDKVPESTSELEIKLVEIMRQSGKIFTAKQMCKDILNEQDPKWFSDKMWNLAKKGVLKKLPTRGFYQYNFDRESQ